MPKTDNLLSQKIEGHVERLISSRSLAPGESLPSERELGRRFNASQFPVRQAISELVKQGLVKKIPGKGTFVTAGAKRRVTADKIAVLYCHPDESFMASPVYSAYLSGVNDAAQGAGKTLLLRSIKRTSDENPNLVFSEMADDVCGFVLVDPLVPVIDEIKDTLASLDVPVVVLNYEGDMPYADRVVFSTGESLARAVRTVHEAGHERIGFLYLRSTLFGGERNPNLVNIKKGYKAGLRQCGLPYDPALMQAMKSPDDETGFTALMESSAPPSAIFLAGDTMAQWIYTMARKAGVSIPGDVSIIGQGGIRDGDLLYPSLATVQFPLPEMGRRGIKMLLEKSAGGGPADTMTSVLSGNFMPKDSFKALRA